MKNHSAAAWLSPSIVLDGVREVEAPLVAVGRAVLALRGRRAVLHVGARRERRGVTPLLLDGLVPGRLLVVRLDRGGLRVRLLAELPRRGVPDDGVEPVDDVELAADVRAAGEGGADADEAADGRQHRQHRQRHPHRRRRLVRQDRAVRVVSVAGGLVRVVPVVYVVAVRVNALRLSRVRALKGVRRADALFGAVVRAVADRRRRGLVRRLAVGVALRVRLVGLPARGHFEEALLAPEGHRHQARHVEGRAGGGDGRDEPEQPAEGT